MKDTITINTYSYTYYLCDFADIRLEKIGKLKNYCILHKLTQRVKIDLLRNQNTNLFLQRHPCDQNNH